MKIKVNVYCMNYDNYTMQLIVNSRDEFSDKIGKILDDRNVCSVEYDREIVDTLK